MLKYIIRRLLQGVGVLFVVTLLTFLVMIYLLVFSAQKLAQVPSVGETLEKYSRWFIAVVYLGLGIYILIENNVFDMLRAVFG